MQVLENDMTGISFAESDNQKMIADMIRDFGKKEITPKMMEWDESQEFPVQVFKKLGELGLMGVLVPEEYAVYGTLLRIVQQGHLPLPFARPRKQRRKLARCLLE